MPIVVPLIISVKQKFVPDMETGTFSAVGHSAVLLLQFREKFLVVTSIAEKNPKLASNPLYQDYQSTL